MPLSTQPYEMVGRPFTRGCCKDGLRDKGNLPQSDHPKQGDACGEMRGYFRLEPSGAVWEMGVRPYAMRAYKDVRVFWKKTPQDGYSRNIICTTG